MLDATKRQELSERLRNRVKKASSNVSTKVEAEKGDFKIVMSRSEIEHLYKNQKVASIKISELTDEDVQLINDNPQDAAHDILNTFIASFDEQEFNKTANVKQAANEALSEKTWDMITQKQLDEQKPKLHPRKDEHYTNVTQKQLPEHGQRPGTYDVTTEAQFRDERKTFYGADRTSGDWRKEDRNTVTEGQLEAGVSDYTEVPASDRGDMGSKFDGDIEKQWKMTGEKQLMELLKHHKWTEPLTTTEGKDQLGKQDGELSRITAEIAQKIIKEALNAMGKTILSVGVTPSDLSDIVKRLVSDKSKFAPLAHTLKLYANTDISSIERKVAKARSFGKTANTGNDWSEFISADVLMRQLGKLQYSPKFIVDGLVALANRKDFVEKISQSTDEIISIPEQKSTETDSISIFAQVLDGSTDKPEVIGDAEDGMYSYAGDISEVGVESTDKEKFASAAAEYAKKQILANVKQASNADLQPQMLDVNTEKGVFEIQFKDVNKTTETIEARAARRREFAKQAASQTKEAQMVGGAGGAPPAAGGGAPEMGNAAPPPGGADMGAPPAGETLSQEPSMDEGAESGPSGEPKPPGSICPACGSEDVDVDNGEFRCNNCGSEGHLHVSLEINKWTGTINEPEETGDKGFGLGEDAGIGAEDAGMASDAGGEGVGTTLPNVPVAASVKVTARMLEKLASQKINLGSVCPNCGGKNTDISKSASSKGNDGICWDCLQEFNVQVKASKAKKNNVVAQYVWKPKLADKDCTGCNRLKEAFVTSLRDYGMSWNEFDGLPNKDKADLILKLSNNGWLNLKTAMESEPLPIQKIAASSRWKGYEKFDKFPSASCMERIARRYGENATSMSGPCQGKSLAQCVCGQLESLGIYTDGIAAKVASLQAHKDPMVNSPMEACVSMLVKDNGYKVAEACTVCDALRAAYASSEELMIEAIAQIMPGTTMPKPMSARPSKPMAPKPMAAPNSAINPATKTPKLPGAGAKPMEMGSGAPGMGAPSPKPMEGISNHLAPDPLAAKPMPAGIGNAVDGAGGAMSGMGQGVGMKPMDGSPLDNPISDSTEGPGDSSFSLEIGDGMSGMGGDADLGLGGDMVTLQLPPDAMQALQTLMQALQGQIGESMIDTTGDDLLDMGDITDGTVDGNEDGDENGVEDSNNDSPFNGGENEDSNNEDESDNGTESDIPGLSEESDDELIKNSDPESEEDSASITASATEEIVEAKTEETPVSKEANLEAMLFTMKRGTVKTQQGALDSLFDGLLRQAKIKTAGKESSEDIKKVKSATGKDTKITVSPAQDAKDIGKIQGGGKIGHEEPFSKGVKTKPDVPRSDALMGDEGKELRISETGDLPTVPHGSGSMEGETHYKPEKGNAVDGNQGSQTTANSKSVAKTAKCKCKCGNPDCSCNCNGGMCAKPCNANSGKSNKTASKESAMKKEANTQTKVVQTWSVQPNHKYYDSFMKRAQSGETSIKLTDGNSYDLFVDQSNNIVLVPQKIAQISQNLDTIKKESQQVTPKKVDRLEDDPDINNGNGPGAGKTHVDKAHSLAVDEKKPSEGVSEVSVPEAPNGGRLGREHTVEKATDGPTIPAGGGMNSDYDQNEKNKPEKLDQMLGKQNDIAAMASNSSDEAIKIAGQMLKANLISADELPSKVRELSNARPEILDDYKKLISRAFETKGMKRQASVGALESGLIVKTAGTAEEENGNLTNAIQGLFKLDRQNQDHARLVAEKGNAQLWR